MARTILLTLSAVLVAAALPACVIFPGNCEHTMLLEPQAAGLADGDHLRLDVGAGSLVVEVVPGLYEARITGEACSSSLVELPGVGVDVSREGGTVVIATAFPVVQDESFGLDLRVQIPEGVRITVNDSSGSILVTGAAGVEITDSSGSIGLQDIGGDVRIEDGSGSIDIGGVRGSVWLSDGSGSIDIREVEGSVTIAEDGSGSILIADVTGDVLISVDGSGDIEVRRVGGDFTVKEGGSGRVHFSAVEGRVTLPGG